jgi:hypothetical protein
MQWVFSRLRCYCCEGRISGHMPCASGGCNGQEERGQTRRRAQGQKRKKGTTPETLVTSHLGSEALRAFERKSSFGVIPSPPGASHDWQAAPRQISPGLVLLVLYIEQGQSRWALVAKSVPTRLLRTASTGSEGRSNREGARETSQLQACKAIPAFNDAELLHLHFNTIEQIRWPSAMAGFLALVPCTTLQIHHVQYFSR